MRAAVGYSARRGDNVEILSFPFTPVAGLDEESVPFYQQPWFATVLRYALTALVALVLVLGLLRFLRLLARPAAPAPAPIDELAHLHGDEMAPDQISISTFGGMALPAPMTGPGAEQLAKAKSVVGNDPALVAQLVKNWINED